MTEELPRETHSEPEQAASAESSRWRRLFRPLLDLFSQQPDQALLPFDQALQLVRNRTGFQRGTRSIPVTHVVGSVGRYRDFNRAFLPLNPAVRERRRHVDLALREQGSLPPIDVYQIGDVYFVRDGNHRVSLAREYGWPTIEAYVTEIESRVPLSPEMDVDDVILKVELARFLERTSLDRSRPEASIELTEPGRFDILLEHIEVHRYYLGLEARRDVSCEEAAGSWYDAVYQPVVEAIRDTGVLREFPQRTEADLYLWVAWHRERLKEKYGDMPPDREVASGLAEQYSERPFQRLVKSVVRALRAAVEAATESPAPPLSDRTHPRSH